MSREKIEQIVKSSIIDTLGEDIEIPNESRLDELGVDSIDIVNLLVMFDEKLGVSLPADNYDGIETVQDVINVLFEFTQQNINNDT